MRVHKATIKNFRLLADAELVFESQTTLVVGRNNSGKTSLSEVIRRFLGEQPKFYFEDFSSCAYSGFCKALKAKNQGENDNEVRKLIPNIELRLLFEYDPRPQYELGPLSSFVIDLNSDCYTALAVARYGLSAGNIEKLFEGQSSTEEDNPAFIQVLRERIPTLFDVSIWAEDPNDSTNYKQLQGKDLRSLLKADFINAQRGLDDNTTKDTDVLAKILEGLFTVAKSSTAGQNEQKIVDALQKAIVDIQNTIQGDFKEQLDKLMPALKKFGYPGLDDPALETETILKVERLLSGFTKVRYAGHQGILLPESYNGLGIRNLIFILLQLVSFYRAYRANSEGFGVHLVFIEEPEAHMHPQMQEVFINQLSKAAEDLNKQDPQLLAWPVQFIVSTHSSHITNMANFDSIRYFFTTSKSNRTRKTEIKDLHNVITRHRDFLNQYLTLTRCDLFFADKVVLIEGTSERLLLPVIIRKLEENEPDSAPKLTSQYMTIMEVGGAHAHKFFELLEFLNLHTLIITDIDSIGADHTACPVHQGKSTSNACIKSWFSDCDHSPNALLKKNDTEKIRGNLRIAFQQPEKQNGACGRTFEDAFMLANPKKFGIKGIDSESQASSAWEKLKNIKKSQFALEYAIDNTEWTAPSYILDGLRWLARSDTKKSDTALVKNTDTSEVTNVNND